LREREREREKVTCDYELSYERELSHYECKVEESITVSTTKKNS